MPAKTQSKESAADKLVIVESPAKAKTIEGYLGKEFKVVSCYGHVRDLPKKNAIDIENGFKPTYEVSPDKKDVIRELKKLSKNAELVYLASDDDREGEAISWHLKESLKLKDDATRRIVFREITKNAILKAIQNPRQIDQDLVNAQQARRILDRLVGFELSPLLWKKIKAGLSAGRVQSVAVRMVVERERQIEDFTPEISYRTHAWFHVEGKLLKAELSQRFTSRAEALTFLESCKNSHYSITDLQVKQGKRKPSAPFTTSTLQQEASRKLGYSVSKTMTLAQKLYEAGKITYMRTDSVSLSDEAMAMASDAITSAYGETYLTNRRSKTKSDSAQEAHEAIRPTNFSVQSAGKDSGEKALYQLIWKRALASQMSEALIEKTTATIDISGHNEHFIATGEVIRFDGFLKLYREGKDDDDSEESKMLPPLSIGQKMPLKNMQSRETFSKPPARYTEASLVKHLEELGIGRPSTYAPTISTIQKREYVLKETRDGKERKYHLLTLENGQLQTEQPTEIYGAEKAKLFPTSLAMIVTDFLIKFFENVVDYSFTANVEKEFDDISQGRKAWNEMISSFYFQDFHPRIEKTADVDRKEVSGNRELGLDPASGKPVIARLGRFGPIVQIGTAEDEEKPRFASLDKDQNLQTITLEEALKLFKLPRTLGEYEAEEVVIGKGPFGPYVRHMGKFTSIPKDENPMELELSRAIELIEAKRQADRERFIKGFEENEDVQILKGRWGPYIKFGKKNVKIPKELKEKAAELSFTDVWKMIEAAPDKKSAKKTTKKTTKAASKTAAKSKTATKAKKTTAKAKTATKAKKTTAKAKTATKAKKATAKTAATKKSGTKKA